MVGHDKYARHRVGNRQRCGVGAGRLRLVGIERCQLGCLSRGLGRGGSRQCGHVGSGRRPARLLQLRDRLPPQRPPPPLGRPPRPSVPSPPSGSQTLQTSNSNGVQYARYSNATEQADAIVSFYSNAWQSEGYAMTNSGGGGGGWGSLRRRCRCWRIRVQVRLLRQRAGGRKLVRPTYFEVCQGPNEQAVDECGKPGAAEQPVELRAPAEPWPVTSSGCRRTSWQPEHPGERCRCGNCGSPRWARGVMCWSTEVR